jgi:hypothetical protein
MTMAAAVSLTWCMHPPLPGPWLQREQKGASQLLKQANNQEQEAVSDSPNAAACWVTDKVCVASSAACDGVAKVSSFRVHAGADPYKNLSPSRLSTAIMSAGCCTLTCSDCLLLQTLLLLKADLAAGILHCLIARAIMLLNQVLMQHSCVCW